MPDTQCPQLRPLTEQPAIIAAHLLADAFLLWMSYCGYENLAGLSLIVAALPLLSYMLLSTLYWHVLMYCWSISLITLLINTILFTSSSSPSWCIVAFSLLIGCMLMTLRWNSLLHLQTLYCEESRMEKMANKMRADSLDTIIGTVSHDIKSQLLPLALG
jgi:hypothetical protein